MARRGTLLAAWSLAAFVLFYNLGGHFLEDWDEAWYVLMAKSAMRTGNYLYLIYQNGVFWDKPPFPLYPMILSFRLFGASELTARIPSALFALGIIAQLFLMAKRFYGATAAVLVPVIAATSVRWIFSHGLRSANIDSMTIFFLTSAITAWLLIRRRSIRLPAVSGSLALLFLCKGPIIAIPLAVLAGAAAAQGPGERPSAKLLLYGLLLFLCIVAPWYIYMYLQFGDLFILKHVVRNFFQRYATGIENHDESDLYFLSELLTPRNFLWFGAALVSVVYFVREYVRVKKREDLTMLLWAGAAFLIVNQSQTKLWWYLYPLYPPLVVMTARTLADFTERRDSLNGMAYYLGLVVALFYLFTIQVFPHSGGSNLVRAALTSLLVCLGAAAAYRRFPRVQRITGMALVSALCLVPVKTAFRAVRTQDGFHPVSLAAERLVKAAPVAALKLYPGDVYYLSKTVGIADYGELKDLRTLAGKNVVVRLDEMKQACAETPGGGFTCSDGQEVYDLAPLTGGGDYRVVRISLRGPAQSEQ